MFEFIKQKSQVKQKNTQNQTRKIANTGLLILFFFNTPSVLQYLSALSSSLYM